MIYLLRHGLDDERFIGGHSNVGLTLEGIKQVKKTIEFMKHNKLVFDRIYSSDIKRAVETADLVAKAYNMNIILDSRLRELDKGLLTGLLQKEAQIKYSKYIENVSIDTCYPKGESMIELYKRQEKVLKWLLTLDRALIVTHRGPINMYYFYLNHELLTNDKKRFGVTHSSLNELDSKQKVLKKIFEPKGDR